MAKESSNNDDIRVVAEFVLATGNSSDETREAARRLLDTLPA